MALDIKKSDEDLPENNKIFGKHEEHAIISLAFDQPEFFSAILPYLKDEYFEAYDSKFVFSLIKYYFEKHNIILSRAMCIDIAKESLTADDPFKDVIDLIARESDPREAPIISDKLIEWAKKRAFARLYSADALEAHERGDYDFVETIIEEANRIQNVGSSFYFFFDQLDELFIDDKEEKLTTGFPKLDADINLGGPSRGEVFLFMAPTGVGKSIALCNATIACNRRNLNVLYVTLEMSKERTSQRLAGIITDMHISKRVALKDLMMQKLRLEEQTNKAKLILKDYPADDVSIDVIQADIDILRRLHGIKIDVVVIDYLELLMSRIPAYNREDYTRQKKVSTEICRLAKKEHVLVFSATQTNRSGNSTNDGTSKNNKDKKNDGDDLIDLNKIAESYGKAMPIDYLVTINQSKQEYEEGLKESSLAKCRLYVVKNRNGPKFTTTSATINYLTMSMKEEGFVSAQLKSKG